MGDSGCLDVSNHVGYASCGRRRSPVAAIRPTCDILTGAAGGPAEAPEGNPMTPILSRLDFPWVFGEPSVFITFSGVLAPDKHRENLLERTAAQRKGHRKPPEGGSRDGREGPTPLSLPDAAVAGKGEGMDPDLCPDLFSKVDFATHIHSCFLPQHAQCHIQLQA